jgi:hypothetical protein
VHAKRQHALSSPSTEELKYKQLFEMMKNEAESSQLYVKEEVTAKATKKQN